MSDFYVNIFILLIIALVTSHFFMTKHHMKENDRGIRIHGGSIWEEHWMERREKKQKEKQYLEKHNTRIRNENNNI